MVNQFQEDYIMTDEQYKQHDDPESYDCMDDIQDRTFIIASNCCFMEKGIHEWKIKLKEEQNAQYFSDYFGVTDNIDICLYASHVMRING